MTRYNFSAKTLDEAITKACVELGVTSDLLDYTVVEQGSAGLLGIGARPWIIAACNKELLEAEEAAAKAEQEKEAAKKKAEEKKAESKKAEAKKAEEKKAEAKKETKKAETVKAEASEESFEKAERRDNLPKNVNVEEISAKAVDFLKSVFDSIGMTVEIETSYDEMMAELSVNLSGEDMGVLIGKRGQTLDSLQYLCGQVINKHTSGYVRVKLDTENYRERRHETLENLAHNMANKVRRTRRPMALEPMNPYERRIIHSTLQDEKDVTTRSEGEEPYRHVVICYVKHKK